MSQTLVRRRRDRFLLAALLLAALGCGRTRLLTPPSDPNPNLDDGGIAGGGGVAGDPRAGAGAGGSMPPPPSCGDGRVDPGEQCDGSPTLTCAGVGFGSGTITCDPESCSFDVSGCSNPPVCELAADT